MDATAIAGLRGRLAGWLRSRAADLAPREAESTEKAQALRSALAQRRVLHPAQAGAPQSRLELRFCRGSNPRRSSARRMSEPGDLLRPHSSLGYRTANIHKPTQPIWIAMPSCSSLNLLGPKHPSG